MAGPSGQPNFVDGGKNWCISGQPRRFQWGLMIAVFFIALIQAPSLSQAQDAKYYDINATNILSTAKSFPVPSRYCSAEEKAYTTGFLSGQIKRAQSLRQEVNAAYKGKRSTVAELAAKQAILTKIRSALSILRKKLSKANRLKPEDCSDPGSIGSIGGGGTTKKGGVKGGGKDKGTFTLPTLVPLIIPRVPAQFCTEQEKTALIQQLTFARGIAQKNRATVNRHDFGSSAAGRAAGKRLFLEQQDNIIIINSRLRQVREAKLAPEEECTDPKKLNTMPSGNFGPGSGRLQTPGGVGQNEVPGDKDTSTDKDKGDDSVGSTDAVPLEEGEVLVATPVTPDPEQEAFDKAVEELEGAINEMSGVGPSFEIPNEETGEGSEESSPAESESRTTEEPEEDPDSGGI